MYIFKPLKQHDSEIYCLFTVIKYQIDENTPGNNTEKKLMRISTQKWVDKHVNE
jgi:hypothetical protein